MTTTNLWKRLRQLLPEAPLLVGTVIEVSPYGVSVQLPDGAVTVVRGTAAVNDNVFIRNGVVEGQAPSLDTVIIEI